jgi:hypothetical protein
MSAVTEANLVTDAHGALALNLTINVPACKTGLVSVLSGVTIVASQAGLDESVILELPIL